VLSHEKTHLNALEPDEIALAENQARANFFTFNKLRAASGGRPDSFVLGDHSLLTALDAHTIAFIARLVGANKAVKNIMSVWPFVAAVLLIQQL